MISNFEFAENVVGVIIDSDVDDELTLKLQNIILEKLRVHEKINLFLEIRRGNKISVTAFLKQMGFNFNHHNNFNKIAVVTNIS